MQLTVPRGCVFGKEGRPGACRGSFPESNEWLEQENIRRQKAKGTAEHWAPWGHPQ